MHRLRVSGCKPNHFRPDSGGPGLDGTLIRALDGPALTAADLARKASVTVSVIRRLAAAGVLREVSVTETEMAPTPGKPTDVLTPAQRGAAEELAGKVEQGGFSVTLLDGVTGSGKTEVYFEAISAAIARDRQVVVLLPEITLTEDWLTRFEKRFGAPAAVWHSGLSTSVRRRTWEAVLSGSATLVVGARSALMLPYRNLGLIVVDEEHDSSFKQEDGVIYNARDMAIVRGRIGCFPVILSTATPSLDTIDNVWRGRYGHVSLPRRHASAKLPEITAIDMRLEPLESGKWMSPTLCTAIRETLAAREQVVLFLNRRGYAPLTLCRACGYRMGCPHCTAWLVEHRSQESLRCHYCGHHMPFPRICPSCEAEDRFSACGPGVERIAVEAGDRFPEARLEIMSSDTVDGPGAAMDLVTRMLNRDVDILIGTQILAKGFHFPWLTLVGVIDSDLGLSGGDLRAAERTYQLLHQVSGRAGRGGRPGRGGSADLSTVPSCNFRLGFRGSGPFPGSRSGVSPTVRHAAIWAAGRGHRVRPQRGGCRQDRRPPRPHGTSTGRYRCPGACPGAFRCYSGPISTQTAAARPQGHERSGRNASVDRSDQ